MNPVRQPPSLNVAKWFPRGCVASPHYLASAAGQAVLASGGNALDAAIATNLTLGVVTPYLCGYGGDVFALIWNDGESVGYNGSGRAPAEATPEAVREAARSDAMPTFGPLTVTVPGAVEGWFAMLERFGSRPFGELAESALRLATDGFVVSRQASASLAAAGDRYREYRDWQEIYGNVREGDVLRQSNLARTIRTLADAGPNAFYRGPIADALVEHLRSLGGVMDRHDLERHRGVWVQPLSSTYRDVEVLELPPNTQGATALEALNIVQEVGQLPADGPERQHLLIEAMKLSLADRDAYITDPAFMTVSAETLISREWARERSLGLDLNRAGRPAPARPAAGGTAYMCAADQSGMMVSLIQSNWMGFGSGVVVPDWGINLHNRGSYFSLDPSHSNVIAPGKRTMHTLVPAMALRGDDPYLVFGSMGGDGQAQTHLQLLVRIIDDGDDIQRAVNAPRWTVSPKEWQVVAESRFARAVLQDLRGRGHDVSIAGSYDSGLGHAHAIQVGDPGYFGATDPRAEGAVRGV